MKSKKTMKDMQLEGTTRILPRGFQCADGKWGSDG